MLFTVLPVEHLPVSNLTIQPCYTIMQTIETYMLFRETTDETDGNANEAADSGKKTDKDDCRCFSSFQFCQFSKVKEKTLKFLTSAPELLLIFVSRFIIKMLSQRLKVY